MPHNDLEQQAHLAESLISPCLTAEFARLEAQDVDRCAIIMGGIDSLARVVESRSRLGDGDAVLNRAMRRFRRIFLESRQIRGGIPMRRPN